MNDVIWKPVHGWSGYEVSACGRVRSWRGLSKGRELSLFPDRDGYLRVNVVGEDGRRAQLAVHRVVILAHGPVQSGPVVRHLDGDPRHNAVENLAWGSQEENEADKRRHGRALEGERHHRAKLTDYAVFEIRSSAESSKLLASRFGVRVETVNCVRRGAAWGHL